MSKPTLGYPSRSAAIWACVGQGETLEQIACKLAMPRANVKTLLGYKHGRFFPKRPGRFLVDREGALHPCVSSSLTLVGAVTIRASEPPAKMASDAAALPVEDNPAPARELEQGPATHRYPVEGCSAVNVAKQDAAPARAGRRSSPAVEAPAQRSVELALDDKQARHRVQDRRQLIHETAARLAVRKEPPVAARLSIGAPSPKPEARQTAALPIEQRRVVLQAAIAFLKTKCILVDPVDRTAALRFYRVSGKRDNQLADEVIAIAVDNGFEVPRA